MLLLAYFSMIIMPCWLVARKCHSDAGAMLFPAVRPGQDHKDMAPRVLNHLVSNNYDKMPDRFGRKNGEHYRNFFRSDVSIKPSLVKKFNMHGFSF